MSRRRTIGFDRRIELDWLDATASHLAAGATLAELRSQMWAYLDGKVSGDKFNSDRGKTMTVLTHIWGKVPPPAQALQARALPAFSQAKNEERLAVHWAMMMATYPVFSDVAAAAGRLLALQSNFSLAQLTKRMVALWSERPVLVKSTQRIIRSMVQWGALEDTETKGMYRALKTRRVLPVETSLLLCQAALLDGERPSFPCTQLLEHPAFFPFALSLSVDDFRKSTHFNVHREGHDTDVIELAQ